MCVGGVVDLDPCLTLNKRMTKCMNTQNRIRVMKHMEFKNHTNIVLYIWWKTKRGIMGNPNFRFSYMDTKTSPRMQTVLA